jgi:uncharacterized protein
LNKIWNFFLTRIIVGTIVVIAAVAFVELLAVKSLDLTSLNSDGKALITALLDSALALTAYIFLFRNYERRPIRELSVDSLAGNASLGFITGFILQSAFILVIYFAGTYSITHTNPWTSLMTPLAHALTAGFVAEIIFCGIIFRLLEQTLGSWLALLSMAVLFAIAHWNVPGANWVSISATAVQSGLLLMSAFMVTRSLWFPIFLHFAWDLTEPGIYGGHNPGMNGEGSLVSSVIKGSDLITGGISGPQNSIQALLLCILTTALFLWIAQKRNHLIQPSWDLRN